MILISFYLGFFTALFCVYLSRRLEHYLASGATGEAQSAALPIPFISKRSKEKKKPKSVSELDQWKKEQSQAPLDPGLG